jgi:hypothetical protein
MRDEAVCPVIYIHFHWGTSLLEDVLTKSCNDVPFLSHGKLKEFIDYGHLSIVSSNYLCSFLEDKLCTFNKGIKNMQCLTYSSAFWRCLCLVLG